MCMNKGVRVCVCVCVCVCACSMTCSMCVDTHLDGIVQGAGEHPPVVSLDVHHVHLAAGGHHSDQGVVVRSCTLLHYRTPGDTCEHMTRNRPTHTS